MSYRNRFQIKEKSFIIFLFVLFFISFKTSGQNIVINEIVDSNSTTILDEDKNSSDCIELYNWGDTTC